MDVKVAAPGNIIASAGKDGNVRLWNNSVQGFSHVMKCHKESVNSISLSPDGQYLLTGSSDKFMKVYSTTDRKFLFNLRGHTNAINTV
jgi:WD40 repeat protein